MSGTRILQPRIFVGNSLAVPVATPAPVAPSGTPNLWIDASQEVAFSNNDPVASAADWSGNGYHLVQAVEGQKPIFKTGIQNSLPAYQFTSGNSSFIQYDHSGVWSAGPWTFFVVYELLEDPGTNRGLMAGGAFGDSVAINLVGTDDFYQVNMADSPGPYTTALTYLNGRTDLLSYSGNGNSSFLRVNGSQETATPQTNSSHFRGWAFGGAQNGSSNVSLNLCEALFYLGNEDYTDNEAYLAAKWGL